MTCDEVLLTEQTLVCMADKLAELADCAEPVTWNVTRLDSGRNGTWIFPMQHPRDRFVARDLAINALAHLGRADFERPKGAGFSEPTCASAYAAVRTAPAKVSNAAYGTLFSSEDCAAPNQGKRCLKDVTRVPLPPVDKAGLVLDAANSRSAALGRLTFNAEVLSAGAALLKELLEASVCDDLAGAYSKRAEAQDPARANLLYWGAVEAKDGQDGPYNSAAHALRLLFGRLESPLIHPPSAGGYWNGWLHYGYWLFAATRGSTATVAPFGDAPWSGYEALWGVQQGALGDAASARWADREITTDGQEQATRLLRAAGIVIPPGLLEGESPAITIEQARTAIRAQLQVHSARFESNLNGVVIDPLTTGFSDPNPADPLALKAGGQLARALDRMDARDLRFAIDRVAGAYRQLADEPTLLAPTAALRQVTDTAALAPELATLKDGAGSAAFVVEGGLVGESPGDGFAKASGLQLGAVEPVFDPRVLLKSADAQRHYDSAEFGMSAAFQDAFLLGDTLRRRLHHLRTLLETDTDAGAVSLARDLDLRSSAIRAWAGPGRVRLLHDVDHPEVLKVTVTGLSPKDLHTVGPENMAGALGFVYGEPWVADCATGARTLCPDGFQGDYVQRAPAVATPTRPKGAPYHGFRLDLDLYTTGDAFDPGDGDGDGERGQDADDRPRHAPKFAPVFTPWGTAQKDALYLIRVPDPATGAKGEVLAALALRPVFPILQSVQKIVVVEAALSAMQQKLARQVLNVSNDWVEPRVGGSSSATSVSYCVRGPSCVFGESKDLFVPLENDLTTNSNDIEDSWRHYLDRARQAATHADALGMELIQLKLGQYEKLEGAQEKVGEICGDYGAIGDVEVGADGALTTADNTDLDTCLNEEVYDLAFLTRDQFADKGVAEQRALLHCDAQDPNKPFDLKLCEKLAASGANKLDTAGLSTVAPYVEAPPTACTDHLALAAAVGRGQGLHGLGSIANEAFLKPDNVLVALRPAHLQVEDNGEWTLDYGGQIVMSTKPPADGSDATYWPACELANAGKLHCDALAKTLAGLFDTLAANASVEAKKAHWRAQVEGMLWTMGALSGTMPAGVLDVPIMAFNWATSATGHDANPVPISMVLAPALYYPTADGNNYKLGAEEAEIAVLGPMTKLDGTLMRGIVEGSDAIGELSGGWPRWLTATLDDALSPGSLAGRRAGQYPPLLRVRGKNVERSYRDSTAHGVGLSSYLRGLSDKGCDGNQLETQLQWSAARNALCPMLRNGSTQAYLKLYLAGGGHDQQTAYAMDVFNLIAADDDRSDGLGREVIHNYGGDGAVSARANSWLRRWAHPNVNYGAKGGIHAEHSESAWLTYDQANRHGHWPQDPEDNDDENFLQATQVALKPRACTPHQRVDLFTNAVAPSADPCDAEKDVARALAMTCLAGLGGELFQRMLEGVEPPRVQQVEDLALVQAWLERQAATLHERMSNLWLRDVPKRAVADHRQKNAGSGPQAGAYGRAVLELGSALGQIGTLVTNVEGDLRSVASTVGTTMLELTNENLNADLASKDLALQTVVAQTQIAKGAAAAVLGTVGGLMGMASPIDAAAQGANGAADMAEGSAKLVILGQMEELREQLHQNNVLRILDEMSNQLTARYTLMETNIAQLREAALKANQQTSLLQSLANEARYQLAKGSGADYLVSEAGGLVTFPVNRVTNRLFPATRCTASRWTRQRPSRRTRRDRRWAWEGPRGFTKSSARRCPAATSSRGCRSLGGPGSHPGAMSTRRSV